MWNSEGVIELIRSMPAVEVKQEEKKNCDECALNTDHGKACFFDKCEFAKRTSSQNGKKKEKGR